MRLAVVGAAAAVVVGVSVIGVPGLIGASAERAEAVELLHRAADRVAFEAVEIPAGHYLRVVNTSTNLTIGGDEGEPIAGLFATERVSYIPSDRSSDWIVRQGDPKAVRVFGAGSREEQDRIAEELAFPSPIDGGEAHWTGGKPSPAEEDPRDDDPLESDPDRDAPRSPDALRAYIDREIGTPDTSRAEAIFEWLRPILADPSRPADLRAAGFEVLATLDGVTVSSRRAVIDGTVGVGVQVAVRDGERKELVFDPDTGMLLGTREVLTEPIQGVPQIPVGTVTGWERYSAGLVDAVPELSADLGA
ncbi:hypothetical protein [Leucobacter iarius]|uniref:hypothetical protein n=1 Tax=Leucobacter iarius TaxID=333963 RepID=UPI0031E146DA